MPNDIRPGSNPDPRNSNTRTTPYPGHGGSDSPSKYGSKIVENSIRDVRIADIANWGSTPALGSMEIGGVVRDIPKIPPMQKFASRPITGPGPLEQQRLAQQQANSMAMGDPDYAPLRELDYESIKDANFATPAQKAASRLDRDFTK